MGSMGNFKRNPGGRAFGRRGYRKADQAAAIPHERGDGQLQSD